jgi:hypothetical protein
MDLNAALKVFDQAEANLVRLERVWSEIQSLIPDGLAFAGGSPEGIQYRQLVRSFYEIRNALPAIDSWKPAAELPGDLDEVAQTRLDWLEIDEPLGSMRYERSLGEPGEEIADYRHRCTQKRQQLVRSRLEELVSLFDTTIRGLAEDVPNDLEPVEDSRFGVLEECFGEMDRLVGNVGTRKGRWRDLTRHLRFGQGHDLHDIANMDWPSVREDIVSSMYGDYEPVPVAVEDLGALTAQRPTGRVTTSLNWEALDDEQFERLLFNILKETAGYENVQLLMKTRAPDRGRDIQAYRVRTDPLSGTSRERVILQCKHWLSKSVTLQDLNANVGQMKLWEPPKVDLLVVATSGHFTTDAVQWVERRVEDRELPRIELWARLHLESLLAQRPHLAVEFGLR